MYETCPIDDGNLSASSRAVIRNGLGKTFDTRFVDLFAGYDSGLYEIDTMSTNNEYDPNRISHDPLITRYAHGRYTHFITREVDEAPTDTDFHPLKVPVGEYGNDAANALLLAGAELVGHIATKGEGSLDCHERILVKQHTYYGMTQKHGELSFLTNQQQGVAFTIHALAALTAQKVEGFATFTELLGAIAERYSTETLTKLVGSLAVTPLVEEGFFVEKPLNPNLTISDDMASYATATRQRHRAKAKQARKDFTKLQQDILTGEIDPDDVDWVEYKRLHQVGALGLSCPAADRGGSVTMTVRALHNTVAKLL